MNDSLLLHHKVTLLAISDDKGVSSGGYVSYAISGAMLCELMRQEKILVNDDKVQTTAVIDESTTGDPILDELLQKIVASKTHYGLQHWVQAGSSIKGLLHKVATQLCEKGILRQDEKKVLWLFTTRVYPEVDGACEDVIRNSLSKAMFDETVDVDDETAILITLASRVNLLTANFPKEDLKNHKDRIKQIAGCGLLATVATDKAIAAAETAIMVATMVTTTLS